MDDGLLEPLPQFRMTQNKPSAPLNVKDTYTGAITTELTPPVTIIGPNNDLCKQNSLERLLDTDDRVSDYGKDDFELRSKPSSLSVSPGLPSSRSSVPTTPQHSPISLVDEVLFDQQESSDRRRDTKHPPGHNEDAATTSGIKSNVGSAITGRDLSIRSQRPHQDQTVSPDKDTTQLGSGAHGPEPLSRNQDFKRTTPPTAEEDEQSGTFQDRLLRTFNRIPGHLGSKGFFPRDTFAALVDEKSVAKELRRYSDRFDSHTIRMLSQKVCGTKPYKKIFGLLVLTHKLLDIETIIEQDVTDDDLPLRKIPHQGDNIFHLARRSDSRKANTPLGCFDSWSTLDIWNFEEWQWTMQAPFFDRGKLNSVQHFLFPDEIPLPFTLDSRYGVESRAVHGGFGTVFKVDIHPEHHSFGGPDISGHSFAVKHLQSTDRAKFKKEVDMLMTFSGNAHTHLISLLGTYEQFNRYYLIFPWAEADLQGYWFNENPSPSMDHDTVLWMANQCHGIAQGLSKIHRHRTFNLSRLTLEDCQQISRCADDLLEWPTGENNPWQLQLFGRHGDIKPQNVLWFHDPGDNAGRGVLKITDFGLAEFKTSAESVYKSNHRVTVSAQYRPPECDIKGASVGQSQDIWAFGCVCLELIAWLLGGRDLLQEFQNQRATKDSNNHGNHPDDGTFFEMASCGQDGIMFPIVKPVVTKFIEDLRARPDCTEYIYEFLSIIQTDMLIVKPPDRRAKGRMGIAEVTRVLDDLRKRCEEFTFATIPWCPKDCIIGGKE